MRRFMIYKLASQTNPLKLPIKLSLAVGVTARDGVGGLARRRGAGRRRRDWPLAGAPAGAPRRGGEAARDARGTGGADRGEVDSVVPRLSRTADLATAG